MELTKKEISGLKKHWGRQMCKPIPQDKFEEKCKALDLVFRGEIADFYSYGIVDCESLKFYWYRHDAIISLGSIHRARRNYKLVSGIDDLVHVNFDDMDSIVQDIAELMQSHKENKVKDEMCLNLKGQYDEVNFNRILKELGLDGQYITHRDKIWLKIYGNGLTTSLRVTKLYEVINDLETADLAAFFKVIKILGLKGKLETK